MSDTELSYSTPEGYTVFTSKFLKNRGTCCKSACLHCPFGFTLKKLGLQFKEVTESDSAQIESIMEESKASKVDWKPFYPDNIRFIVIKETICGVMLKNHIVVKHIYLKPHYQNQDLSKEMIESYFFI
jgi:hypothetical protein